MNVSSEMQALCDGIVSASVNRANRLDSLKNETNALRRDARRMVKSFHNSFAAMACGLRSSRKCENDARKKTVAGLRSEFRKELRVVGADLAAAKRIWATIAKR